ncbi:MAG TPA: hypothetical protein VHS78_08420 [Candidatus Elarobacter sp.]|jgi:hypothetical protein|nr:hypothetical protein [Candidatus Elarobacter sp.]
MFPLPPTRHISQREIEENDARFRRSNRGGDDLATKIVFAVVVLAIAGWVTLVWFHREHTAVKPPPHLQSR